jgi:hypothetical protein
VAQNFLFGGVGPEGNLQRVEVLDALVKMAEGNEDWLGQRMRDGRAALDDRMLAARALVGLGNAKAMQVFAEAALAETDDTVRAGLMGALDGLHAAEGIEMLASLAGQTTDPVVLAGVEDALSRLASAETVGYLAELYDEAGATGQRDGVLQVISGIKNPPAIPALASLAGAPATDPGVFRAAVTALSKSGQRAGVTGLLAAWDSVTDEARRRLLLEGLAEVREKEELDALEGIAMDSPHMEIQEAAGVALARARREGAR